MTHGPYYMISTLDGGGEYFISRKEVVLMVEALSIPEIFAPLKLNWFR